MLMNTFCIILCLIRISPTLEYIEEDLDEYVLYNTLLDKDFSNNRIIEEDLDEYVLYNTLLDKDFSNNRMHRRC